MKTAISVPDPLFRMGERLARKLRVSRSQLYASALAEFVEAHRADDVTRRLNDVYGTEASGLDPALERLQAEAIGPEVW